MSAFKRFGPGDQVDNVLIFEPSWVLSSGSAGWHGSPEGSASVSLYGGYNRRQGGVVQEYVFQRTIQGTDSFGKLSRSGPITASVNFVYLTRDERSITERSNQRWGYEHWKTVEGLYEYYHRRDPDYVTASYDHYCMFFSSGSSNILTVFDAQQLSGPLTSRGLPTGSYTLEAWFKPFSTSSAGHEFTIMSHARAYKLYVSGSTGKLAFAIHSGTSAIQTTVTSSFGPTAGEWHHAAVSFDHTTLTGTMYLDLQRVATFTSPSGIPNPINYTGSLQVGAAWGGGVTTSGGAISEDPSIGTVTASFGTTFHGFIGNVRVWDDALSYTEISSSHNARLSGSDLASPLAVDIQMREGPLSYVGHTVAGSALMGSGTLDHSELARSTSVYDFGVMYSFDDRPGPGWHPNDNTRFYVQKQFAPMMMSGTGWGPLYSADVTRMLVLSVPAGMYGRRIVPNTVSLTCCAFDDPSYGLTRTLIDDGRGGLFLSGSARANPTGRAYAGSYRGVEWNKVGNVFYDEGLVVIKDPALLDFGAPWTEAAFDDSYLIDFSFHGESRIPVKTLMCRIDRGDLNASLNQTFWEEEEDGDRVRTHPDDDIYISTVGLYNSDRELVGVARLAEPLRVRPRDRMNVKLRMDF